MSAGDAVVTLLATWLTAGLGGWLGPLFAGFVKRLWTEFKSNKAKVDAGAQQQRDAEQVNVDRAASGAEEARREAERLSAAERERELAGWLQPGGKDR